MAKRILIVDDNELMIEVMTYILLNNGYEVASSTRVHEIFRIIKASHPDLVILDIVNESMDGRELCRLIKLNSTTKNLRVIVCCENEETEPTKPQKGSLTQFYRNPSVWEALLTRFRSSLLRNQNIN